MLISETRQCNIYNLKQLALFLDCPIDILIKFYEELFLDELLLGKINSTMDQVIYTHGFRKGIFSKGFLDNIDWFAYQRSLIYVLVRYLKPKHILETGVYYGGNTIFLLAAVMKNDFGTVHSVDLPDSQISEITKNSDTNGILLRHHKVGDSELYDKSLTPGFLVPEYLKKRWEFIEGNSLEIIPALDHQLDFYVHDSEHSFSFLDCELNATLEKLTENAVIVVDDIGWSNAFFKFCVEHKLYPLLSTDNGKDDLMVRTGMVKMNHPYNRLLDVTGP